MPAPLRLLLAIPLVALATGCKPDDPIRTYTVPKEKKEAKPEAATGFLPSKPAPTAADKFRMLAAVVPADERYFWSIKLAGPVESLAPLEADFVSFVQSIKAGNDSNVTPTYTPPAGWETAPPAQMRLVTFKKGGVEMYLATPVGGGVAANVNRWRGQLGLREVSAMEVEEELNKAKLGEKTIYTVDLRGPTFSGGAGMKPPPFAPK